MKIFKKISIHLILTSFIIVPIFVFAQGDTQTTPDTTIGIHITNPLKNNDGSLMSLITAILNNVVMPIAAVAVVIWIVWAGFTFLTAQGKEAEITKAKSRLLWSLIGAGILLGAGAISKVVETTITALINT